MGSRSFFRVKAEQQAPTAGLEESYMSIGTIILIILVIALLGGFSGIGGGPFYGTGYYGGGGLGLVIVILLILLLLGKTCKLSVSFRDASEQSRARDRPGRVIQYSSDVATARRVRACCDSARVRRNGD